MQLLPQLRQNYSLLVGLTDFCLDNRIVLCFNLVETRAQSL